MFDIGDTAIDGVKTITSRRQADLRGTFTKLVHADTFAEHGLRSDFREVYYSSSKRNVIRGMHFQTPPHDHAKLVQCLAGGVIDVVVDVRRSSATFGSVLSFDLSVDWPTAVYIPAGCAHGFMATTDDALMLYSVTSVYSPPSDGGIRWDSIGFQWPCEEPIVSERDKSFAPLKDFLSPFA